MKNIGSIFKYNPWINDTHTKYIWDTFLIQPQYPHEPWHSNWYESWKTVVRMREPIKEKIYEEHKLKK
jgi:hypothetical protein